MWTLPMLLLGGFGCAPPPYDTGEELGDPSITILFPESDPSITYCTVFTVVVDIDNLEMNADDIGGDHVPGQGHWHLYIDGEYVTYNTVPWATTPTIAEGLIPISVDIAQNDHQPYQVNGQTPTYIAEINVADVEGCVGGGNAAMMDTGY